MNWENLKKYTDSNGLVTLNDQAVDGIGAGNLLLHTCLAYVYAYKVNYIIPRVFREVIKLCEVGYYPGLYWRSPYKIGDQQQHDDYIGIAAAAYFYDRSIAKEIVSHGESHGWCYNSHNPEKFEVTLLHDRFPGQVSFYKMCSGEKLSIWEALPLAIRTLIMSYSKDSDSAIHSYLFFSVGMAAMPLLFYPFWWVSGKPLGKSFEKYLGPGHPLCEIDK